MDCVSIAPKPYVLRGLRQQNLPWWKVLGELIDNSFGAGATRVVIRTIGKRVVEVTDDGFGVKDPVALFQLGNHQSSSGLSMYGIGAKDAWFHCGGTMTVDTVHQGKRARMTCSLDEIESSGSWAVSPPVVEPSTRQSGTTIRLSLKRGKQPPGEHVRARIALLFTPALKSGRQIVFQADSRKKPLTAVELPALLPGHIEQSFVIDGRSVSIRIGIIEEGQVWLNGPFWIVYKHRVIESGSTIGVGQYSARRLAGVITLGAGWSLSKNKDAIVDMREELADAIFIRIEGILKEATSLSETIEINQLRMELEDSINTAIRTGKAKRPGDSGQTGSLLPKGTGRRHKRAAIVDGEGDSSQTTKAGRKRGVKLDFRDLESGLGKYDMGGNTVTLNTRHPYITSIVPDNKQAILCCVGAILADFCCSHDAGSNRLMQFSQGDFGDSFGRLMESM